MAAAKRSSTTTTTLRLTFEEAEAVRAAAAARGVGPSTFARVATLRAAGRASPPVSRHRTDLAIEIAGAMNSLCRIGRNLDQLVHLAKEDSVIRSADVHDLRSSVDRLARAVL